MSKGQLSRRALIAGLAGLAAYGIPAPAAAEYLRRVGLRQDGFEIRPRSDWAGTSRPPTYELEPEDVQLLVVHHTLIPGNGYNEDRVAGLLRAIYDYHTGPEKGWPDIAYNFMVDQFGGIWEAREGSLDGPVRGSATGGNQGYSQLCCFLGDLSSRPPTEQASASMAWLLAQLADRYSIETSPGATVTLESLGSSRFAAGAAMTLSTLSGHRDVSLTACPGDAGYGFLQQTIPGLVNARRVEAAATTTTTTSTTAPTTVATTESPTTEPPSTVAEEATADDDAVGSQSVDDQSATAPGASAGGGDEDRSILPFVIGGATLAAAGLGIVGVAKRRLDQDDSEELPTVPTVAPEPDEGAERSDGTISVPSRLGLGRVPDIFAADPGTEGEQAGMTTTLVVSPPAVMPEGPQRVWWAVPDQASTETETQVRELSHDIHLHASSPAEDPDLDLKEWSRLDTLLATQAESTTAAVVAARSDAVFVLRSNPCLVVVTRPDGVVKRDHSRDALRVAREDIARIAVHFDTEETSPDIEVTAD